MADGNNMPAQVEATVDPFEDYEDGLTEAIAAVTVALVEQYPAAEDGTERHANELPDGPVVISN